MSDTISSTVQTWLLIPDASAGVVGQGLASVLWERVQSLALLYGRIENLRKLGVI